MGDRQGLEPGSLLPVQHIFSAGRARVAIGPRSSLLGTPSRLLGPPAPGSPDVGRDWGSCAPPPPAPRHLGALRRPLWTAPNRCSSSYSPTLPGARPPATSATPATAKRSRSVTRGEARTVAMSGPDSPEPRDARTQPGRRSCSLRPRPGALGL